MSSVFMLIVKRMKERFKSEMDDIYTDSIKFGLFSFNVVLGVGTFGRQLYDIIFKENIEATVQLTIKEFLWKSKVRNRQHYAWWTKLLNNKNVVVKINHLLLSDTPCGVVKSSYGLTSFLERLPIQSHTCARRVLKINLADNYGLIWYSFDREFAQSNLNNIGVKGLKKEEPEIECQEIGNFLEKVFSLPWSRSSTTP
ncbi:hypothetical protein H5410_024790 [Solanum commersonii]|uniref:Uncharacterized protein n=1 Tax=Solanum commersonii TaxID=4109 RepID=A0A9J5ZMW8_SOLCO|nr:hypothetical protein H5410_024790 [Solanum commersonii]